MTSQDGQTRTTPDDPPRLAVSPADALDRQASTHDEAALDMAAAESPADRATPWPAATFVLPGVFPEPEPDLAVPGTASNDDLGFPPPDAGRSGGRAVGDGGPPSMAADAPAEDGSDLLEAAAFASVAANAQLPDEGRAAASAAGDAAADVPAVDNAFVGDVADDGGYAACVVAPPAVAGPAVFPRLAADDSAGSDPVRSYQAHFLEGDEDDPEYVAHVEPAGERLLAAGTAAPPNTPRPTRASTPAAAAAVEVPPAGLLDPVPPVRAPASRTADDPRAAGSPNGTGAAARRRAKPQASVDDPHHFRPVATAVTSDRILLAMVGTSDPTSQQVPDDPAEDVPPGGYAESDETVGDPVDEPSPPGRGVRPGDADGDRGAGDDAEVGAAEATEYEADEDDRDADDRGAADGAGPAAGDADADTEADARDDADAEDDEALAAAGPTGGGWTIPLLCAGVAVIACCLVIPQADANRRLAHERAALRADLETVQTQVATNDEFLRKLAGDPTLAERLAHRQLNLQRPNTRVLSIRHGEPGTSPFDLVQVPPPPHVGPYEPLGGRLATVCRNARSRLYAMGAGLFLLAAGLVLGAGGGERRHRVEG